MAVMAPNLPRKNRRACPATQGRPAPSRPAHPPTTERSSTNVLRRHEQDVLTLVAVRHVRVLLPQMSERDVDDFVLRRACQRLPAGTVEHPFIPASLGHATHSATTLADGAP